MTTIMLPYHYDDNMRRQIMMEYDVVNIAGIEEEDGTITCKNCMDEEQWVNLSENQIISVGKIERGKRIYFCDYCEKRL